ncbi:MAG: biopolymer transporter ExbD [Sutterella sp.]|jgi:biopolymer transport protein ExbD|nr:biopolymer transporter ExbD [Mesosutterella multiformis]MBS5812164.1 biopolymer transporter ExbD [Sutterella sp.]RHH07303.1 biopolymer transporter ExbD [Sutterella sp. AM18-8-1]
MKLQDHKTSQTPTLMIIPMIDIIFFLLVFFMMSMLNMVTQKTIPVKLPAAATASVDRTKSVPVAIKADGSIFIEDQPTTIEALGPALEARKTEDGKAPVVVLMPDRTLDVGRMVQVMDTVRAAGVDRLTVAAKNGR